jgi:predicted hotdog family 3-hydroxylacyl-ACP dehydratase
MESRYETHSPSGSLDLCAVLIGSCSSFAHLKSDDYRQAGIRVTTNPADAAHLQVANRWSSEFEFTYSAQDVGVWSASQLAKDGR